MIRIKKISWHLKAQIIFLVEVLFYKFLIQSHFTSRGKRNQAPHVYLFPKIGKGDISLAFRKTFLYSKCLFFKVCINIKLS